MNPIVRMMKRYIKMPLKYALPLLFIGALVLSATAGCDGPSPTATPTVKATATATHDAFLEKYLAEYKNEVESNASRQVNLWSVEWINSLSLIHI